MIPVPTLALSGFIPHSNRAPTTFQPLLPVSCPPPHPRLCVSRLKSGIPPYLSVSITCQLSSHLFRTSRPISSPHLCLILCFSPRLPSLRVPHAASASPLAMRGMRSGSGGRGRSVRRVAAAGHATETTPLVAGSTGAAPARDDAIQWWQTWEMARPYVIPHTLRLKLLVASCVAAALLRKACSLLPPYAYKLAVDRLADNQASGGKRGVVPYAAVGLFVAGKIGAALFGSYKNYSYAILSTSFKCRFSVDLFGHLQNLSLAFHLRRRTGEVVRVMERGADSIDTIANTVVFTLFPTLVETVVVTSIFLKLGTPWIALATLLTVVAYFAYTFLVTNWRIKFRRDLIDAENALSEKAVDTLFNYETVKMFGMESDEISAYDRLTKAYKDAYVWFRVTLSSLNLGQTVIQTTGLGITMLLAAIAAVHGSVSPGDFVLVNAYVLQLFGPLLFLGSSYRMLTQAATDVEKCVALFETDIDVKDAPDARNLDMDPTELEKKHIGEVCFDNVSFKYKGSERGDSGGLRNISFRVAPGKMVALVGASGAGKSTIMRLLLRFYDVDNGAVLIDGQNVKTFTQRSLRRQIGVVAQDTILFNQDLRFNISYGKQDASDAEIYAAAQSAALGEFIDALPEKLDTKVGERGVRLSGGERQRVGCARCIIKDPSIVLLDEASSALDTQTEREMQSNLRLVCKNRTTIVIAHRLSTVMMADEIIVLGKHNSDETLGSIMERGSHSELLKQKGRYAEMWEAQSTIDGNTLSEITDVSKIET